MPGHDIVTIGASAGGVEALSKLVADLPTDLPAAVFVVLHLLPESVSVLPRILDRAGPLKARHAEDAERIKPGRVYIAPPDRHLIVKEGFIHVSAGPKENRHRPAIDTLFRSAARIYGARVVGVVLSGSSDDGVAGLRAIRNRGGVAVVQDPSDAIYPELPQNAIEFVNVDHIVPIARMGAILEQITHQAAPAQPGVVSPNLQKEARLAEVDLGTIENEDKVGTPSAFSCPDCGGVLWELQDGDLLRFRCRVGHSYTATALSSEHSDSTEKALWAAFRTLEENASFSRRLSMRARRAGHSGLAERFMTRAEEASANAASVRQVLLRLENVDTTELTSK